uniref:Uncharacterized protein n=1 Tax=Stomoxys calcitrans TaxID=35570 RepID=A0A1I8NPD8_STOCA
MLYIEIKFQYQCAKKYLSVSLWKCRKQLAASVSRMRIKYGALQLSNLLPIHLQNEKVAIAATNPVITGWINPFLVRDRVAAENILRSNGFNVIDSDQELNKSQFKWDTVCPLFLSCIPLDRNEFAKSELVQGNLFIIQEPWLGSSGSTVVRIQISPNKITYIEKPTNDAKYNFPSQNYARPTHNYQLLHHVILHRTMQTMSRDSVKGKSILNTYFFYLI